MSLLRLGMIIPSSNTVVEQETCALLAGLSGVSAHFSRFKLTKKVSATDAAAAYYDSGLMLEAASLLADCRCTVITWSGTSGGIVGFERDRRCIAELEAATGTPATTAALSVIDAFHAFGVRRVGLVTLNPPDTNRQIAAHFAAEGFECVATSDRTDLADNFAMAEVPPEALAQAAFECARARPEAITVFGTNVRGAPVVAQLERELGIPVVDSVAAGAWGALRRAGIDTRRLAEHGRIFELTI